MTKRQQSAIVAIIVLLLSASFLIGSFFIMVDGVYPRIIAIGMIAFCVIDLFQNFAEGRAEKKLPHHELTETEMTTEELAQHMVEEHEEKVPWKDLVAVVLTAFVSLILWRPISFFFAGIIAMMAISLYKKRPIIKSLIISVCTVVIIQIVFRNIFTIPLPSPGWWPKF